MGQRLERLSQELVDIRDSLTRNITIGFGVGGLVGSLATNAANNWHAITTSQATYPDYGSWLGTSVAVGVGVYLFFAGVDYLREKCSARL